jgi:hypothetical protein
MSSFVVHFQFLNAQLRGSERKEGLQEEYGRGKKRKLKRGKRKWRSRERDEKE